MEASQTPRETAAIIAGAVLSCAGAFVAGTLWWAHRSGRELPCTGDGHGCDLVASSRWAHVTFGPVHNLPLALVGLVTYLVLLTLYLALLGSETTAARSAMLFAVRVVALGGVCYSWFLQYVAHYLIGAFCVWCFSSACIMTGIVILACVPARGRRARQ